MMCTRKPERRLRPSVMSHTMDTATVKGADQALRLCLKKIRALKDQKVFTQIAVCAPELRDQQDALIAVKKRKDDKVYFSAVMCTRIGERRKSGPDVLFMDGVRLPLSHPAHSWKWLMVPLGFYPMMGNKRTLPVRVVAHFLPASVAIQCKFLGQKMHHNRDHAAGAPGGRGPLPAGSLPHPP